VSVCVIGSGPGGMFFCYHMDQKLKEGRDDDAIGHSSSSRTGTMDMMNLRTRKNVNIQCFERASSPGGVWRKADSNDTSSSDAVEMYDNLWTNGSSHNMEFFDYTFDEHFDGAPVHVYLQRKDVLDYMLSRVTRDCPDFFDKYVQFNTEVNHVTFVDAKQKFEVKTIDLLTKAVTVQDFDYCVWAGGANGRQKLPKTTIHRLRSGGYSGPIMHSADSANLEETVRGKRILLVGGSYSAEDLAIQAVKLGVEHVDIVTRSEEANVNWVRNWPGHKITIHRNVQILKGGAPNTVHFEDVWWEWPDRYVGTGTIASTLHNIDAVLFCTGYDSAFQMLDPKLLVKSKQVPLQLPEGWEMSTNDFTKHLGDVKPADQVYYCSGHSPELYHGVVIDNPRMMYFQDLTSSPMMDHDAFAYMFAQLISGDMPLPSKEIMRQQNLKRALKEMNFPNYRIYMDENYNNIIGNVPGLFNYDGAVSDAWSAELSKETPYSIELLADIMQAAEYPFSLGTYDELNEAGKRVALHDTLCSYHRSMKTDKENASDDRSQWTTFRDYDDGHKFQSIYTATKAINLESNWLVM